MMIKTEKKTGFTLIELLIVVAIIAILAAIAIPNFLAAQIRSKVSRVKANMRTCATALESYFVDNNCYPGDYTNRASWGYNTLAVPIFVTTPISYITKVPDDIFDVFAGFGPGYHKIRYRIAGWAYNTDSGNATGNPILGLDDPYFVVNTGSGNPSDDQGPFPTRESNQTNIQYVLFSFGPGQQLANGTFGTGFFPDGAAGHIPQPFRYWYDPTNGTVSLGYLVRDSGGAGSP